MYSLLYLEKIQVQLLEAFYVVPPLACVEETNLKSLESPDKSVRGTMSPVKVSLPSQNSNTPAGAFPDHHLLNQVYILTLACPSTGCSVGGTGCV